MKKKNPFCQIVTQATKTIQLGGKYPNFVKILELQGKLHNTNS